MRRRATLTLLLLAGLLALAVPTLARAATSWSPESGGDAVATIADLEVSSDAIAPGTGTATDRITLTFRSTIAQHVRITVLDQLGREVRSMVDADIPAGPASYTWFGDGPDGASAPDGTYEIVVEAETRHDTLSVSDVVRVDRHAPTITTPTRRIRLTSMSAKSFKLPVVASERTLVALGTVSAAGRARTTTTSAAGRTTLVVPLASGARFRRALARGHARVGLTIVANDDAGNTATQTVAIDLLPPLDPSTSTGDDPIVGGSSKITWPLSGPITSRFGMRWGRMHNGIDIGVPTGRQIGAAAPGTVTYAGWMSGYGNTVIIDHGSIDTLYGHQSKIKVHVGQRVVRGHVIGLVGSTGNSTGPHLHFEVRVGGTAKDPLRYLP